MGVIRRLLRRELDKTMVPWPEYDHHQYDDLNPEAPVWRDDLQAKADDVQAQE